MGGYTGKQIIIDLNTNREKLKKSIQRFLLDSLAGLE